MKLLSLQKMKEMAGRGGGGIQSEAFIQYCEAKAIIYHVQLGLQKRIFREHSDLTIKRTPL